MSPAHGEISGGFYLCLMICVEVEKGFQKDFRAWKDFYSPEAFLRKANKFE